MLFAAATGGRSRWRRIAPACMTRFVEVVAPAKDQPRRGSDFEQAQRETRAARDLNNLVRESYPTTRPGRDPVAEERVVWNAAPTTCSSSPLGG
jgi:hypothetical protein